MYCALLIHKCTAAHVLLVVCNNCCCGVISDTAVKTAGNYTDLACRVASAGLASTS